jgi:GxxExxY protein
MGAGKESFFREECYKIRGAVFEVYKTLNCGFLEAVYQEALSVEFERQNIPFVAQPSICLSYKGIPLEQSYRPDFICFNQIIVELKAVEALAKIHRAQMINYLRATDKSLGLLVNFGAFPHAEVIRIRV